MGSKVKLRETPPTLSVTTEEPFKSMGQIIWQQFLEHRFAVFGLILIAFFGLISLAAPLLSTVLGVDPLSQNVFYRYQKPFTSLPYPSELQEQEMEEFVQNNPEEASALIRSVQKSFPQDFTMPEETTSTSTSTSNRESTEFLLSILAEMEAADFKQDMIALAQQEKGVQKFLRLTGSWRSTHLLGTDELGRDVLMRLLYGTRVSIGIGLVVSLASAIIGLLVGSISGYYGGFLDSVLMRITDSLLSLPLLPVLIVFAAIDLRKIPLFNFFLGTEGESLFKLIFILCLFSWMTVARLVRGSILGLKEREFIQAAKTLGARDSWIILGHIIPNTIAPLLVAVSLNVGQSILSEAALSFLGLGIQPPIPSWGNMLFNAQELIYEAPLQAILPGVLILLAVISFNFVGDGLQDAIDPRSIRR